MIVSVILAAAYVHANGVAERRVQCVRKDKADISKVILRKVNEETGGLIVFEDVMDNRIPRETLEKVTTIPQTRLPSNLDNLILKVNDKSNCNTLCVRGDDGDCIVKGYGRSLPMFF